MCQTIYDGVLHVKIRFETYPVKGILTFSRLFCASFNVNSCLINVALRTSDLDYDLHNADVDNSNNN